MKITDVQTTTAIPLNPPFLKGVRKANAGDFFPLMQRGKPKAGGFIRIFR
jgi:hypothetical protein